MKKGVRYWLGEIWENIGLPLLGLVLLVVIFGVVVRLPWWVVAGIVIAVFAAEPIIFRRGNRKGAPPS